MRNKKETINIKVDRPRRNNVSKERLPASYTFETQKCNRGKKMENVLKKRMTVINNLLIQQMHGKITLSKKSILKYLKELREMDVHCTKENLKQVNEKLSRCMKVCLTEYEDNENIPIEETIIPQTVKTNIYCSSNYGTADKNAQGMIDTQNNEQKLIAGMSVEEVSQKNSIVPHTDNTNTFCSYGNEIIERSDTPVLRSDQSTPSNIDLQEIMGSQYEEFFKNNTTLIENVMKNDNLELFNDVQTHRSREISTRDETSIIASKSIEKADGDNNIQGKTVGHSTEQSNFINYATSMYNSDVSFESESLLKDQDISEYITYDETIKKGAKYVMKDVPLKLPIDNILKNPAELSHIHLGAYNMLSNTEMIVGNNHSNVHLNYIEQTNIEKSNENESQSLLKEKEIAINIELSGKSLDNTIKIITEETFIPSNSISNTGIIQKSFVSTDVLKDTALKNKLNKTKKKNVSNISLIGTEPKKAKVSKNQKKKKGNNNINDTMSNLFIDPKKGTAVSFNGNKTNACSESMNCSSSSRQEIVPNSMTECTNFSISCNDMTDTQNSTAANDNNCDWSTFMNPHLKWLKNVQFIRTIQHEEFLSARNLPDSFWDDDSVPSEIIIDFD